MVWLRGIVRSEEHFKQRTRVRHLHLVIISRKAHRKISLFEKSLDLVWKQYHCGLEIEKFLILSLYISSITYGKENCLKCDAIPHVIMKMVLEMDFSISVKTLARLK